MMSSRTRRAAPPLDKDRLEALALHYAARYATTRAKLHKYLARKIIERGWSEENPADIAGLVARLVDLRYVDDAAYARMKAGAMQRRGLGQRRIGQMLLHAGVDESDRLPALESSDRERWEAAERLARRKRIGPFGSDNSDRPTREKHVATFLRAGHDMATARAWAYSASGDAPPCPDEDTI